MRTQTGLRLCPLNTLRLQISNLGHRYGGRKLFQGVNLDAAAGTVVAVLGPNGTGKSTFLKIVAGLLTPWQGTVSLSLDGAALTGEKRRHIIGMTAPDMALYQELSGAENLAFFASLRGLNPDTAMLRSSLEKVGLKGRGRDLVSDYSSGMRQRLRLAVAQLGSPRLLLLDEPSSNLDASGIEIVESVLNQHREAGHIVLIATNAPHEMEWGDVHLQVAQL